RDVFFFQAEDGIRDRIVTGVQTCALPIFTESRIADHEIANWDFQLGDFMISDTRLGEAELGPIWSKDGERLFFIGSENGATGLRSGERRGGKECGARRARGEVRAGGGAVV